MYAVKTVAKDGIGFAGTDGARGVRAARPPQPRVDVDQEPMARP